MADRGFYLAWSLLMAIVLSLRLVSLQITGSSHYGYNIVLQLVKPVHILYILYSICNFVVLVFSIVGQVMDVIWRVQGRTRFAFGGTGV